MANIQSSQPQPYGRFGISQQTPQQPEKCELDLKYIGSHEIQGHIDYAEAGRPLGIREFEEHKSELESPWFSSALSQLIADALLWVISLVVYGRVVHFATVNGFYHPNSETWNTLPRNGRITYVGVLYYFIVALLYGVGIVPAALTTIIIPTRSAPKTRKPY